MIQSEESLRIGRLEGRMLRLEHALSRTERETDRSIALLHLVMAMCTGISVGALAIVLIGTM